MKKIIVALFMVCMFVGVANADADTKTSTSLSAEEVKSLKELYNETKKKINNLTTAHVTCNEVTLKIGNGSNLGWKCGNEFQDITKEKCSALVKKQLNDKLGCNSGDIECSEEKSSKGSVFSCATKSSNCSCPNKIDLSSRVEFKVQQCGTKVARFPGKPLGIICQDPSEEDTPGGGGTPSNSVRPD